MPVPGRDRGRSRLGESSRNQLPLARDLDQVAARVVEDGCRHGARFDRLLREPDTPPTKSLELVPNVVDGKRGEGDAVLDERLLERLRGGVRVWLEKQFGSLWLLWGYDRQPASFAKRYLCLLRKSEHVGVEPQCPVLVVDQDARDVDSHVDASLSPRSQRSAMCSSGSVLR